MALTSKESKTLHIISPHQDDAAFSLALTLAQLLGSGFAANIVNCFTVSQYQPLGPARSVGMVSQIRHAEDLEFIAKLPGLQLTDLGFRDAPLRLGRSPDNVCINPNDLERSFIDPGKAALEQRFLELPPADFTFIPLAIGGHIDHLLARDEAIAAFRAKPIVMYQDLPYAGRFNDPDHEIAEILAFCNLPCSPLSIPVDGRFEEKLSYISAYNSQASSAELEAIASYPGGERLWVSERALALMPELNLLAGQSS